MPDFQPEQHVAINGAPVQQAVFLQHIADVAGDALDLFPLDVHGTGRGLQQPARMDSSVDLPQPLGPTMLMNSPLSMENDMFSRGLVTSPFCGLILLLYVLHPKNFQTITSRPAIS